MKTLEVNDELYLKHQLSHVDIGCDYGLSEWMPRVLNEYRQYLVGPLLDVGTRNGLMLDELEKIGVEAHGIEITDIAKLAQEHGRKVTQGDIQKGTAYPDKFFKSCLMSHVLEHFTDPISVFKELHRILSGYLIIIVPIQGTWNMEHEAAQHGHHTFFEDTDDLKKFVTDNGFEIVEEFRDGPWKQYIIAKNG